MGTDVQITGYSEFIINREIQMRETHRHLMKSIPYMKASRRR